MRTESISHTSESFVASEASETPVLVVVLREPSELKRVRDCGWYRIPVKRAPSRVAAEYLAFYRTGAFPASERWQVSEYAAVRSYRLATRRELIPSEMDHPRANDTYYRVDLGPLLPLDHPIPSRRLRRVTFISTTWSRLVEAEEINDLWIKNTAQERLWRALRSSGLDVECNYPLDDEDGDAIADLAVFGERQRVCIWIDPVGAGTSIREHDMTEYRVSAHRWVALTVSAERACAQTPEVVAEVRALINCAGVADKN